VLSAALAVLAAIAGGLGSVLQRKAAREQPPSESMNVRLIWHLLHRPVWFGGIASLIAGFLLQAIALSNGRISVVESVLVLDLPVALVFSSFILQGRMRAREWATIAAMAGALAGMLLSLAPAGGSASGVSGAAWAIAIGANAVLIAVGVAWGLVSPQGARKAAVLGTTASCGFGLTAALMKGATGTASQDFGELFTTWQLYAMIIAGAGSAFLLQSAVHAGPLLAAQPGISLADPVVSTLWGTQVFGERVRGGVHLVLAAVAAAVVVAAVVVLAHSPLLGDDGEAEGSPGRPRAEVGES
jgi:uncharacterized protein YceK